MVVQQLISPAGGFLVLVSPSFRKGEVGPCFKLSWRGFLLLQVIEQSPHSLDLWPPLLVQISPSCLFCFAFLCKRGVKRIFSLPPLPSSPLRWVGWAEAQAEPSALGFVRSSCGRSCWEIAERSFGGAPSAPCLPWPQMTKGPLCCQTGLMLSQPLMLTHFSSSFT